MVEKTFTWEIKELCRAMRKMYRIPGVKTRKELIWQIIFAIPILLIPYSCLGMSRITALLFSATNLGKKIFAILYITAWLFIICYSFYFLFFRRGYQIRKEIYKNKERYLLPKEISLTDNVFRQSDAEFSWEAVFNPKKSMVIFYGPVVYGTEREADESTWVRWFFPRRVFLDAEEEQAFRQLCEKYCPVKDLI